MLNDSCCDICTSCDDYYCINKCYVISSENRSVLNQTIVIIKGTCADNSYKVIDKYNPDDQY